MAGDADRSSRDPSTRLISLIEVTIVEPLRHAAVWRDALSGRCGRWRETNRQRRWATQKQPDIGRRRVVGESQVWQCIEDAIQRDLDLEAGEHGPEAEVPAAAKREVGGLARERTLRVGLGPVQVEAIGIGEAALVAVGRAQKAHDLGPRGQHPAGDLHLFAGLTRHHVGRRGVAERLGDRARQQRPVLPHGRQRVGMRQQVAQRGRESLLGGFTAREHHEHREADDLFVGQPVALDRGRRQRGDQIGARALAARRR